MINDHINLSGLVGSSPLHGPNDESFGARFIALSDAYDFSLRRRVWAAWEELQTEKHKSDLTKGAALEQRKLHEGTYVFVSGPAYETRAEASMLNLFGADLVGMSTVPEVVVARHAGIRVCALSIVTNRVLIEKVKSARDASTEERGQEREGEEQEKANHDEVMREGKAAAETVEALMRIVIWNLDVEEN